MEITAFQIGAKRVDLTETASNDVAGREWVVTAHLVDGMHGFNCRAISSMQAFDETERRYPTAVRVEIRPLIELTEGEGRLRFPELLHGLASSDALRGWLAAAQGAEARLQTVVIRNDIVNGQGPAYLKALAAQQQREEFRMGFPR